MAHLYKPLSVTKVRKVRRVRRGGGDRDWLSGTPRYETDSGKVLKFLPPEALAVLILLMAWAVCVQTASRYRTVIKLNDIGTSISMRFVPRTHVEDPTTALSVPRLCIS